jgi:probable HAF family extracellular repeat protein
MSSLGTFGGPNSEAGGINNAGVVAGSADLANGNSRAFTYAGGVKTALGTSGGSSSYGYGINNAGTVAGASYLAGDLTYHAVTYSGGAITDLGTLGGAASFGRAINDAGAVAGWSTNSSGDGRAFLAAGGVMTDPTAVPEPASFPAVLAALGLVGMMRRRKGRVRK